MKFVTLPFPLVQALLRRVRGFQDIPEACYMHF